MTLDEAIKHYKKVAEELRQEGTIEMNEKFGYSLEDCLESAKTHEQLSSWLEELVELRKFVRFVTSEVVDDTFEESANCFAEVICRKLVKLGYVEIKDDTYLDIVNVKNVDENNSRKRGR